MAEISVKDKLRFTILGCGSSPGVPRPNGDWGSCDPLEPKNLRYRTSLLVERVSANGKTSVVIDTGADFRSQAIDAGITNLDGVVYTHPHADHIHGIDDLRTFGIGQNKLIDIYSDAATLNRLHEAFGYCFKTPKGSNYPPILRAHQIGPYDHFKINGAGGELEFQTHLQTHGDIHSLGFRMGNVAYCTDVSAFPEESLTKLFDLDVLIIGALQYQPHPSHFSLSQALDWIDYLRPKRAILTHMHIYLDYHTVLRETPDYVEPAYNGLQFEVDC